MADQLVRRLVAVLRLVRGQHRNKRLAERAFGKQSAKQIGNAERNVERIGQHIRPEHRGHEQIAHQPQHPGGKRQQRNGGGGFEQ
ncbi:hypothetical protein SDC9_156208 [bioreactor metagenome]|uniref:Uncharacterized protein n=1 Tax=bioreactor metagenome TaxID=1076179 RepID=A0A645F4Y4_9ZZZZ